jgi:hypothetical protein
VAEGVVLSGTELLTVSGTPVPSTALANVDGLAEELAVDPAFTGTYTPIADPTFTGIATAPKARITSAGAASPKGMAVGNATGSSFTNPWGLFATDDVRSKFIEFFGQGGDVAGTPQAQGLIAKYFAKTTEDSAQASSFGVFLVDTGTPFTQTLPVTGFEADAVVQGGNTVTNKVVGGAFVAEAQNTATIASAFPVYIAAKAAKAAGSTVTFWAGVYVEDPSTGSLGTITDQVGIYSKPRMQTETGLIIGITEAATSAGQKGTRLMVAGIANEASNPIFAIQKGSGSTANVMEIRDSGGNVVVAWGQGGAQLVMKAGGTSHSFASAIGPILVLGDLSTAPNANYTSGLGLFAWSEGGMLHVRSGAGGIITLDATTLELINPDIITSGETTVQRRYGAATAPGTFSSQQLRLTYFTARKSFTVANLVAETGTTAAGATPTLVRLGLYTVAGNGDITLVASTPNDTALFANTFTSYTKALSVAYPITAGTRYAVGVLVVSAATIPILLGVGMGSGMAATAPRVAGQIASQADLPAGPVAAASITGSGLQHCVALTP